MVSELVRAARGVGADALLVSAPPYNKPPQAGIVAHYRAVLEAGDLPLIIYNVPSRTACNILPATVEEIAEDPRVVGVKEASGDVVQVAELSRRVGDRLALYSGNDDQVVAMLALGGKGVISVLGNIAPAAVSRMVHRFLAGDLEEARRLLYVGMTRAKDRLVLTHVRERGERAGGGHRFLDEMGLVPDER